MNDAVVIRINEYSSPFESWPVSASPITALNTEDGDGINIGFVKSDAMCHTAIKQIRSATPRKNFFALWPTLFLT